MGLFGNGNGNGQGAAGTQQQAPQTQHGGWFPGLGGAVPGGGGAHVHPGVYDVIVHNTTRKVSSNPAKAGKQLAIVELEIEQVITAYDADPNGWAATNKVGERCGVIWDCNDAYGLGLGNLKGYLVAVLQTATDDVIRAVASATGDAPPDVISDELRQVFRDLHVGSLSASDWDAVAERLTRPEDTSTRGVRLRLTAGKTRTKAGKPFTPLSFAPR